MKIRNITLVFENVEAITIAVSEIKKLVLNNIIDENTLTLNENKEMEQKSTKKAGYVYLVLDKKADVYYATYGGKSNMTVFERIQKFSDITNIELEYENGNKEIYGVSWDKAIMEEENAGEQHNVMKDGSLCIRIE